jgi:hypothetical protein
MLRACAPKYDKSWDKSLPYAEFSYNNSYQASIEMTSFEALYGRQCRTPLIWSQTGENLNVAQSRQKSYADKRGETFHSKLMILSILRFPL